MSSRQLVTVTATMALAAALVAAIVPNAVAAPKGVSFAQLSAVKQTMDRRLTKPPAGITSWYADPASGRVKVSVVKGDATALAAAKQTISGLAGVQIEYVTERPRLLSNNLISGQKIIGIGKGYCSIGFSARDRIGSLHVITAGHCAEIGPKWNGYNNTALGQSADSAFPGDDFGTIRVTSSNWTPTDLVQGGPSVHGSTEAAVGADVCRSGATSGYHCGTIQAKNVTVNYGGGDVVYGLTRTTACAEPGDSGGSFITPAGQAQGLTSGGSGNCTSGGTTFFQPINEALDRYHLNLVTTEPTATAYLCSDVDYGDTCSAVGGAQPNLSTIDVGNDRLSSVRVPAGSYLSLYNDYGFGGACQYFTADTPTLIGTRIGNDTVSSVKMTSTPPTDCSP